jgi:hypothetical protein
VSPRALLLAAVAWLAAACVQMPPSPDASPPMPGIDAAPLRASPVRFEIHNDRTRPVYILVSQAFWQLVRGGAALPAYDSCELCNCDSCARCAVCAQLPTVETVRPGQALVFDWPGLVFPVVQDGCRAGVSCESPQVAAPGPLTVRVQYSLSTEPDLISGGVGLGPTMVAQTPFVHPPNAPVVVSIQ